MSKIFIEIFPKQSKIHKFIAQNLRPAKNFVLYGSPQLSG